MSHTSKMVERLTYRKTQAYMPAHAQTHMYTETEAHQSTYRHAWR